MIATAMLEGNLTIVKLVLLLTTTKYISILNTDFYSVQGVNISGQIPTVQKQNWITDISNESQLLPWFLQDFLHSTAPVQHQKKELMEN